MGRRGARQWLQCGLAVRTEWIETSENVEIVEVGVHWNSEIFWEPDPPGVGTRLPQC